MNALILAASLVLGCNASSPSVHHAHPVVAPPIQDLERELIEREEAGILADGDRRLVNQLSVLPVTIAIERVAISDLISLLEKSIGAPITVDCRFLRECGIDANAQLKFELRNRTAFDAVSKLVDWLNARSTQLVRWTVWEGEVVIGLAQELRPRTTLIVYDVRDLIQATDAATRQVQVDQIISVIHQNVSPITWRDLGGDIGSIQNLNGNLIITNTMPNHRAIEDLLNELRAAALVQILVETTVMTSDRPLSELGVALPAPVDAGAVTPVRIIEKDRRAAVLEQLLQAPGSGRLSTPRVLVRNTGHATIDVASDVMVELPVLGEDVSVPVRLLDGVAVNMQAHINEARDRIALEMTARYSAIETGGEHPRQRGAMQTFDLDLPDGSLAVIEIQVTHHELLGVRRATDRMNDGQSLEVLREEFDSESEQTILLLIHSRVAVPERQAG